MELRRPAPRIGVMGPSICSSETYNLAREIGFHIGIQGAILVCGGMSGAMEACAKGAKEANGITVGILPGQSAADANPYIDIPIVTGLGIARNAINILTSQAIIAVGGAYGTLSEIALALKCNIPVIGVRTWHLIPPDGEPPQIILADSAEEAVAAAIKACQS